MVNQIISAARYNNLQGRIATILGPGASDKGYNQVISSSTVPVNDTVEALHMNNLYSDFVNTRTHQTGAIPVSIFTVATSGEITEALHAAYESLINSIENDRFLVDASQAEASSAGINSTRTADWGGPSAAPQAVTHEFKATFTSANARRGFFNAGGEIRFAANLNPSIGSGDDYLKTKNWADMLTAIGVVTFGYTATTASGSGTGSSIGNLDLTSTYQTIYTKTGSAVYTDNEYIIQAKALNSREIQFLITFQDDANGAGGADEVVKGTLTSTVTQYRADGPYVDTPAPGYTLVSAL
jgi:hypothetical protein